MIVRFRAAFFCPAISQILTGDFYSPSNHCIHMHSEVDFNGGKPIRLLSSFRRTPSTCPCPLQEATACCFQFLEKHPSFLSLQDQKIHFCRANTTAAAQQDRKSMIWYVWPVMYWIVGLFLANHQCLHLPCKKQSLHSRYCRECTDALTGLLALEFGSRVFG